MSPHSITSRPWVCEADYDLMASWWRAVGVEPMPVDCFPADGCVALVDGKPAAMSFCYRTGARVAWVAFTVACPEVKARSRLAAIETAIGGAIRLARDHVGQGGFIWSMTDHPTLQRIYVERLGFTASSLAGNYVIAGQDVPTGMLI